MSDTTSPESRSEAEVTDTLSGRDLELVQRECELQSATSPEQVFGMTEALREAKRVAIGGHLDAMTAQDVLALDNRLATQIEDRNGDGWRQTVVTFRNGGAATAPQNLPDAMAKWAEAYALRELSADELYYSYEAHHPYEDGNGRTGWALWSIKTYQQTGTWPTDLPPNMFGDDGTPPVQGESAFGPIER